MNHRLITYDLPAAADLRIYVVTDTHFDAKHPNDFRPIMTKVRKLQPDVIVFAGDTINGLADIATTASQDFLRNFFGDLSKIAPVYLGVGNHDQMYLKDHVFLPEKAAAEQKIFTDFVDSIPGVTLLHNKKVEIAKQVNLIGVTLPRSCYQHANSKSTREDVSELKKVLAAHQVLWRNTAKGDTNLLLVHSPRRFSREVMAELPEIDYVITGHMHQGCVPFGLDEKLPGTIGLIAPGYWPLPVRARRTYPKYSQKLLVLPAFSVFSGKRRKLQRFFPRSHNLIKLIKK